MMNKNKVPDNIQEFILKCLSFEPKDRPTAEECWNIVKTWN